MQSIAAYCAPVAKMAHPFRVYPSAAERRSNGWKRRHLEPDEVVDDFEDVWPPSAPFFAREHCVADAIRSH